MKNKIRFWLYIPLGLLIVGSIVTAFTLNQKSQRPLEHYTPKDGFVPNETTAINIAKAIWLPIYGNNILDKSPFNAILKDSSVWIVKGILPEGVKGGVPYIEIRKSNCEILKVEHGK